MEQIIVTHLDNTTLILQSKENVSAITRANQQVELLGADTVDITVESATKLNFYIGDKITIIGRDYTLNTPAKEKKYSERKFVYDLQFEGVQYDLLRASYSVNVDTTNNEIQDLSGDSLTGDLKMFLDVLISNANRVFPNKWILGTYPLETETKTLTFSDTDNCLSVVQSLCSEANFNTEFSIVIGQNGVRTLNIGATGNVFPFTFEYGRGKGLYELTREKTSSTNIVTRLSVYGSSRNINTTKYRAFRLCLPNKTKSQSYIESATGIANYGIWEQTKNFEIIFPRRTGTISSLGDNELKFVDTSMNFDLNEKDGNGNTLFLVPGAAAKIHFNTGNLAGYEFEITNYNHTTKTFSIRPFTDENGYTFPSPTTQAFQFAQGDKYVILDIYLPQSYIDAAESELATLGQEYLDRYSQPNVMYGLNIDPLFLKNVVGADVESNIVWVGDYMPVKDSDLDVDKSIRVKGFSRDLLKDYAYSITVSDLPVTVNTINRVVSELRGLDNVVRINNLADPARARKNYLNAQEVLSMIFDQEGDFYTEKIKPLSIDTSMLSVGAKYMQFGMAGTIFQPNYAGAKNIVVYTGGALTHYSILDGSDNPRTWTVANGDVVLGSDAAYYIYAKCERTGSNGSILFSASQLLVDSDSTYYHFLIGVINSVGADNERAVALMYGFSTINGRFIKTGRVQSADGQTYFDLDAGEFRGNLKFTSGQSVQESVDSKKRNFISQPTTPYEAGDLWSQGTAGELMRCKTTRLTGSYNASDWEKAVKYTDDSAVINMEIGGRNYIPHNSSFWEQGSLSTATGTNSVASTRIRTIGYIDIGLIKSVVLSRLQNSDTIVYITEYNSSFSYLGTLSGVVWQTIFPSTHTIRTNTKYIRIVIARSGGQNIDINYIATVKLKLESGNKVTDWTPAPEDVDAQINAFNYLKTAMQNSTDIQGGLLSTTLIKLGAVNQSGSWVEKAGINGAGTTDSTPRIYAGGTLQQAINRIAGMISNAAKFVVTQGGKIYGMEVELFGSFSTAPPGGKRIHISHEASAVNIHDEAGAVKTTITSEAIPTLASLLAPNSSSVDASQSISLFAQNNSQSDTKYSATLTLPSGASNFTITTPPITLSVVASVIGSMDFANATVNAYLVKPDSNEVHLGGAGAYASGGYPTDSQNLTIPSQVLSGMPSGNYRIKLTAGVSASADASATADISITSPDNILSGVSVVEVSRILRNGLFIIQDANNFAYLNPSGIVEKSQVAPNRPGILASANVSSAGLSSRGWGPKYNESSKVATGTYRITHSIGHTNYTVQITTEIAARIGRISTRTSTYVDIVMTNTSGTSTDTSFDYCLIGSN